MAIYMQQPDSRLQTAVRRLGVTVSRGPLNANQTLLLVLVLVIIPTISGVALIA